MTKREKPGPADRARGSALPAPRERCGRPRDDPERAKIVLPRYFAGLTGQETAALLGVSLSHVDRAWRFVRAWLRRELAGEDPQEVGGNG